MKKIAIIGAGALGTAIAEVLKKRITVELWDQNPKNIPHLKPLSKVIAGADAVFLCVPSYAVRDVAIKILPLISKKTIILSFAKGFEMTTGKTMDALLEELFPRGQNFGIVGGPLLAAELRAGSLGVAIVASTQKTVKDSIQKLFVGTRVSVETTSDMRSVALLSVIKNIYTIALGAVDGLGWGKNIKGKVLVKVILEMEKLLPLLGGKKNEVCGFAGLGDLVATGYSPESRNYQFGYALAQNRHSNKPCEGPISLMVLKKRLGTNSKKFPLLSALSNIIQDPKITSTQLERALKRK